MGVKLADGYSDNGAPALASPSGAGEQQMELSAVAEAFRGVGVEELPFGVSELTPKQRGFVLAYLKTGTAQAAARLAGVNETNSSKMLKKPGVLRLLNTVAQQVAANGDQLVRRQWELSVSLHDELMRIRGKSDEERTGYDERREAQLIKSLNQTNTLLAALLNRLGVKLSGELTTTQNINVTSVGAIVAPEYLNAFPVTRAGVLGEQGEGRAE